MERIFAAADIGSNTAHMLVARTDGFKVQEIDNENEWIGLGEIVAREGELSDAIVDSLTTLLANYRATAKQLGAESIYFFATEAMRSAANHREVSKRLRKALGMTIHVIDSSRETELSARGIELDIRVRDVDVLFEVGGGSAQVAQLQGGSLKDSESLPLGTGTVIAKNAVRHPCPESVLEDVRQYVAKSLEDAAFQPSGKIGVASGGVARGLWRALHPDGDPTLDREELEYLVWACKRIEVETIAERFKVKTKRAGTLMVGALVYLELLRWSKVQRLTVSEYGIREGAILEMAAGKIKGCPLRENKSN